MTSLRSEYGLRVQNYYKVGERIKYMLLFAVSDSLQVLARWQPPRLAGVPPRPEPRLHRAPLLDHRLGQGRLRRGGAVSEYPQGERGYDFFLRNLCNFEIR